MNKHFYEPFEHSYSNNIEKIESYKCQFCGKVVSKYIDVDNLTKVQAKCNNKKSRALLREIISNEYDCTVHNETLSYKLHILKKKLKLKLRRLFKKVSIKFIKFTFFIMYIRSLF
jgi:hypothetical protein